MADKNITVVKTKRPDEVAEFAFTSLASSDTVVVPCDFKDEHTMLLFLGGHRELFDSPQLHQKQNPVISMVTGDFSVFSRVFRGLFLLKNSIILRM